MENIRVLHLIDSAGLYGAETVVLALLEELRNSPIQATLGCIVDKSGGDVPLMMEAQRRGIRVERFPLRRGMDLIGIARILRYAKSTHVRILHCHGYKPDILLALVPHSWARTVSTVHGWSIQTGDLRVSAYRLLDSFALRRMDQVIAVSSHVRDELVRRGLGNSKVRVIYNGIVARQSEQNRSSVRADFGVSDRSFVIGAVGRLEAVKGHKYLIEALARIGPELGDWRCFIAGEGPLRDELLKLIGRHDLQENIKLVGYQSPISDFLGMLDLFVMPSLSEGLPIALLEAMYFSRPVVASAVGGMREVLTDDENATLVPGGDSESLASAIMLIAGRSDLRSKYSQNGRATVNSRFIASAMAAQYVQTYQHCISSAI